MVGLISDTEDFTARKLSGIEGTLRQDRAVLQDGMAEQQNTEVKTDRTSKK